jgi:hypothetical protein
VYFEVNFSGAISPPSAFAANSVVGFLDLDTDKNAATGGDAPWGGPVPGGHSWINFFVAAGSVPGPPINLGDEYFVDLGSEAFNAGFVDVISTTTGFPVISVPITYTATGFSLAIPLSALGNPSPPNFNFGGVVGTFNESTDRFPNGATPAEVTPEPASIVLFGVAGLAACGVMWRRRTPVQK